MPQIRHEPTANACFSKGREGSAPILQGGKDAANPLARPPPLQTIRNNGASIGVGWPGTLPDDLCVKCAGSSQAAQIHSLDDGTQLLKSHHLQLSHALPRHSENAADLFQGKLNWKADTVAHPQNEPLPGQQIR